MNMTISVEKDIVWLDITMYDALAVYVSQSTAQLSYPKPHGVFCESLSGNVEPQIATAHEVDNKVPGATSALKQGRTTVQSVERTCILCLESCSASCR